MAATFDAAGYGENTSSGTSIPDFTVTQAGTDGAVAVVLLFSNNAVSGVTVTIGGVSASLISGTDTGSTVDYRSMIYGLATGSASGSQTVAVSWTGSSWAGASALAATSVNQSTPFSNGTTNTGGSGPTASITINSATDDLTFAGFAAESGAQPTSPTQTQVHADRVEYQVGVGTSRAAGAATVTHQWNTGSGWAYSGVNIKSGGGGGGGTANSYYYMANQ